MSDASRLVNAMRKAAKPREDEIVDVVMGTVTSIKPLKIKVDKLELTESFLILGALCKAATIKIPKNLESADSIPDNANSEDFFVDVKLWRGLKVGDDVHMIRCSRGQKYYVLQRKEGIV